MTNTPVPRSQPSIVKRLRAWHIPGETITGDVQLCLDAADRIVKIYTANAALRARVEELEAALRKSETVLGKIAAWLGRLATASEQRAKDNRFPSLAHANAGDAKNYRATIVSIMPALESARAALPQSSGVAREARES